MPDRSDPRYRLAGCLILSAILHGLTLMVSTSATSGDPRAVGLHPPLLARLVPPLDGSSAPMPAQEPDVSGSPGPNAASDTPAAPSREPTAEAVSETRGGPIPVDGEPFLPASYLTQQPQALSNPPEEALLRVMQLAPRGMAIMTLWIDRHGHVSRLEIDRTNLPPEAAAIISRSFAGLQFEPGLRNGKPVNSVIQMEVKVY